MQQAFANLATLQQIYCDLEMEARHLLRDGSSDLEFTFGELAVAAAGWDLFKDLAVSLCLAQAGGVGTAYVAEQIRNEMLEALCVLQSIYRSVESAADAEFRAAMQEQARKEHEEFVRQRDAAWVDQAELMRDWNG